MHYLSLWWSGLPRDVICIAQTLNAAAGALKFTFFSFRRQVAKSKHMPASAGILRRTHAKSPFLRYTIPSIACHPTWQTAAAFQLSDRKACATNGGKFFINAQYTSKYNKSGSGFPVAAAGLCRSSVKIVNPGARRGQASKQTFYDDYGKLQESICNKKSLLELDIWRLFPTSVVADVVLVNVSCQGKKAMMTILPWFHLIVVNQAIWDAPLVCCQTYKVMKHALIKKGPKQ